VAEYGLKTRPAICYRAARRGLWPGVRQRITPRVGIDTFGTFLHLGGANQIPLTYVDNCAEAMVLAGIAPGIDGEVFNIVDDDLPSSGLF